MCHKWTVFGVWSGEPQGSPWPRRSCGAPQFSVCRAGVGCSWCTMGRPARWNGPAFYTIGGASFGLQLGGEASEVVLLAMTERGVMALLGDSAKLGADPLAA